MKGKERTRKRELGRGRRERLGYQVLPVSVLMMKWQQLMGKEGKMKRRESYDTLYIFTDISTRP